jgi:hypothetical protein
MARHSVAVSLPAFSLGSSALEISVNINGEHAGYLMVSRGSVDWKDAHKRQTGGVSWSELKDFLSDQSPRRVRPRLVSSGRARARGRAARGQR